MSFRKYLRTKLKSFLLKIGNIMRKLSGLPDKTIGIFIRSYHVAAPRDFIIVSLFAPQIICFSIIMFLLVIYLLFALFDGCFLSILEQHFCNDDFTIIDPVLELFKIDMNNKNKMLISFISGALYLLIILTIYYFRFYKNYDIMKLMIFVEPFIQPFTSFVNPIIKTQE
jgi:hypothetical protein